MKGAAKCDKHCELQNSVNQQVLERIELLILIHIQLRPLLVSARHGALVPVTRVVYPAPRDDI